MPEYVDVCTHISVKITFIHVCVYDYVYVSMYVPKKPWEVQVYKVHSYKDENIQVHSCVCL